jgi:hypothetical protein
MIRGLSIDNKKKYIAENQSAKQIVDYLVIAIDDSQKYFPQLNKKFNTGNKFDTTLSIWNYAVDNLVFVKEPPENQNVKTASRVIDDVKNDCKGFSTFICSSLLACDIPAKLRLASYNKYDTTPTHVYVVATINGKEVIVDGTLKRFNDEAPYTSAYDVKPILTKNKNKMALNYLSGIDQLNGKDDRKRRRDERKDRRDDRRDARDDRRQARKESRGERRGRLKEKIAKIAIAPARGAFLLMVKANMLKLANKFVKGATKDSDKLKKFWAKFGGNWEDLQKAIAKGSGQTISGYWDKLLSNSDKNWNKQMVGEVATLTAGLAVATPLLIAVATLFKELGVFDGKEDEEDLENTIDGGLDIIENDPNFEKSIVTTDGSSDVYKTRSGTAPTSMTTKSTAGEWFTENKTLVIAGAGALALFYFMSTKK